VKNHDGDSYGDIQDILERYKILERAHTTLSEKNT